MKDNIAKIAISVIIGGIFALIVVAPIEMGDNTRLDHERDEEIIKKDSVVEDSPILEEDVRPISKERLEELKDDSSDNSVSVGDLEAVDSDVLQAQKRSSAEFSVDYETQEIRACVDWSDGVLNDIQLETMREIAAKLYEQKLNGQLNKERFRVQVCTTTAEDVARFATPVFYYTMGDGILVVQLRLVIYDLQEETEKEILVPVSMKYNHDVVNIIEK